jgi:hypothetical protein
LKGRWRWIWEAEALSRRREQIWYGVDRRAVAGGFGRFVMPSSEKGG